VRNSYNCGVLGHHAERIAGAGMMALCGNPPLFNGVHP